MKIGMRKPSIKKSIKARTTGKVKRKVKKAVVPGYGKKGMGWIKSPKKALYNKVYKKTTFSITDLFKGNNKSSGLSIIYLFLLIIALPFLAIYGIIKLIIYIINRCRSSKDADSLSDDNTDIQAIYSDNQYQIETENTLSGIYNESSSFINSNDGGKKKMGKGKVAITAGAVAVALAAVVGIGLSGDKSANNETTTNDIIESSSIVQVQESATDESTTIEIKTEKTTIDVTTEKPTTTEATTTTTKPTTTEATTTTTRPTTTETTYVPIVPAVATTKKNTTVPRTNNSTSEQDYVLNTNTMKFHKTTCSSVGEMASKNKQEYHGTRDSVLAMGYSPCGKCHP